MGIGEAQRGEELEQFVGRPETPADEHRQGGPQRRPGPPLVDDLAERLEDGHGDHARNKCVGGLVELDDAGHEPGLVEDRRSGVRRGQQPAGEVHRSGGGERSDGPGR